MSEMKVRKLGNMCYDRLREVAPDYTVAAGDEWDKKPMLKKQEALAFKRAFTAEQMKVLRRGHVPEAMEDKWFWYMQGNKLYAHRSWTGICIYIVEFCPGHVLRVHVNRNPKQYYCTSDFAKYLHIPVEETIAVGDADNDIPSIKAAGLGVAMGNANANVKDIWGIRQAK